MKIIIYQAQFHHPSTRMERLSFSLLPTSMHRVPNFQYTPLPYIYVKYVKSHCDQVCRCINNSLPLPPLLCSLHLPISPIPAAILPAFLLLHPHTFSCCINTPPALMKVRILLLCRSSSLLLVLSQLGEEGAWNETHCCPFIHIS